MKDLKTTDQLREHAAAHALLQALLFIAEGNWDAAHDIAQQKEGTRDYDLVHALLHRIEGDDFNARYWYRRANSEYPDGSTDTEWEIISKQFMLTYTH